MEFQFHNGTINTCYECRSNFLDFDLCLCFVQLIHVMNVDRKKEKKFQFHNGTINTLY